MIDEKDCQHKIKLELFTLLYSRAVKRHGEKICPIPGGSWTDSMIFMDHGECQLCYHINGDDNTYAETFHLKELKENLGTILLNKKEG